MTEMEMNPLFCNEPAGYSTLHDASTYNIDTNVRRAALYVGDTALLVNLAAGDMIAIEAIKTIYVRCTTEAGRRHPMAMVDRNIV